MAVAPGGTGAPGGASVVGDDVGARRRRGAALVRFAGLEEAAAEVADAVEPAGGVASGLDRPHGYFFFDLPLPLALAPPLDFAALSASAHSRP